MIVRDTSNFRLITEGVKSADVAVAYPLKNQN